ncbi:MAG: YqgE/AlgH family protein [Gammaproteobacteria bacterium]
MNNRQQSRIRLCAFALLVACMAGWGGTAPARTAPATGRFLVAASGQPGVFSGSVVLLIAYGPDGALGLIVNQPTKFPLAKALSNESELPDSNKPLYFGGPVALDHLTLLIRSKTPPPDALRVLDDIYSSGSMKTLQAVAGNKFPGARFRGYAGYAGWAPGQLDSEIARGGWYVLAANADEVFTVDPAGLWKKLIHRQKLRWVDALRTDSPRQRFLSMHDARLDADKAAGGRF